MKPKPACMATSNFNLYFFSLLALLFLSSCSSVGLIDESELPLKITSTGGFLKVYLLLQLSILFVSVILSFFLSRLGYIIALLLHFILIVKYRDYGFWIVLLLFSLFTIISILVNFLISFLKVMIRSRK